MGLSWLRLLAGDARHACRSIARMPVVAAVVVISLGVGIGVNTVVFSWIQAWVFQPLPGVTRSADLHWIEPRSDNGGYPGVSWLEYRDLRERLQTFQELIAFRMAPLYLGDADRVERTYGLLVSANYFADLGVRPVLGRFLLPEDVARAGGEPVAVISYGVWQNRFAGADTVLGRTLRVNGSELTIVGVTPRFFQGTVLGLNFDVWVPATLAPTLIRGTRELDERGARSYSVMGRLRPGVAIAQAQGDVTVTMRQLAQAYPETNATLGAEVLPFGGSPRGPQRLLTTALGVLQGLMLLLLLAVCGNTANLVLARASARQREVGVRLALGSPPWRIASLMLTENVLLGIGGAVLGAAIAFWGTPALVTLPRSGLPIRLQTSVDGGGLLFALVLGVACGAVFGAAPAAQLARLDPSLALRAGAKSTGRSGVRLLLMGAQVALALVVLILAGLFYRSFAQTHDTDPGFRRDGVLLAAYDLAGRGATSATSREFAAHILDSLRALPAVEAAAISSSMPLDIHGLPSRAFTLEGRARDDAGADAALTNTVTPGYFALMGIPLLSGADFMDLTVPPGDATPPQAIVNDAFVRRYLGDAEPIGRRLESRGRRFVICGVVRTSLYNAFGEAPTPIIYLSYRDAPAGAGEIHVRGRGGADIGLAADIRRVVHGLDAERPIFNVRTLNDHIETNLVFRRVPARLFTVLGPLMLVLVSIGIYAVAAYSVSLRTTEIGVRLALGATAGRVVAQFIGESLVVVSLGGLVGWGVAGAAAIALAPDGAIDLPVFVVVPAILLVVATLACWLPARRAARVDPLVALRRD